MPLKKNFNIETKVWLWPGQGGWHFITLPENISRPIRKAYPKGFVKIEAKVGKSIFRTSLFPHKLSKGYILCINKKIRKIEGIFAGDKIKLKIEIL